MTYYLFIIHKNTYLPPLQISILWNPFLSFTKNVGISECLLYISGGLFEHNFREQELVFKYAIEKINSRRDLLPFTKLTYDIQETPADDSFISSKKGKILISNSNVDRSSIHWLNNMIDIKLESVCTRMHNK